MANASIAENATNKAQFLTIVPGPQKPIIQLLTGNAGFVGSLSDLIEFEFSETLAISEFFRKFKAGFSKNYFALCRVKSKTCERGWRFITSSKRAKITLIF